MFDDVTLSRFWSNIDKRGPDDCWEWRGPKDLKGYGLFIVKSKKLRATRVALELSGKPRQENLIALHSCDNPPCTNPAHLRWGTYKDNSKDALERGRHKKAAQTHCVKGHELRGENLKIRFDGYRACRECLREASRKCMARLRSERKHKEPKP